MSEDLPKYSAVTGGRANQTMQRVEYLKTDGGCPKVVAYVCDDTGLEQFLERDCQANDWLPFAPSAEERQVARSIRDEASKEGGILRLHHTHGILRIDWAR
jgi:hypothetical protein